MAVTRLGHPANGARLRGPHRVARPARQSRRSRRPPDFGPVRPPLRAPRAGRQDARAASGRSPAAPGLRFGRPAAAVRGCIAPSAGACARHRRGRHGGRSRPASRGGGFDAGPMPRLRLSPCWPPARWASATPPCRAESASRRCAARRMGGRGHRGRRHRRRAAASLGSRHALRPRRRAHADPGRDRSRAAVARLVCADARKTASRIPFPPSAPGSAGNSSFA